LWEERKTREIPGDDKKRLREAKILSGRGRDALNKESVQEDKRILRLRKSGAKRVYAGESWVSGRTTTMRRFDL